MYLSLFLFLSLLSSVAAFDIFVHFLDVNFSKKCQSEK